MKINQRHVKRAGIKPYLLATSAISLISFGFVATASAQEATDPKKDDTVVVVTGIRKGIQDAISAKKRSVQIAESVFAEDIGKLPDNSIAESIARLPGIAAQRTNGRAQSLSLRGLGPDYTVTTLNGREQVSTNDNRSVEFDQYPSELINAVLVYKTANASMVNQGIAGTADLQTVRPLTVGKRIIAVNGRYEKNSEKAALGGYKNTGSRYAGTYIDQFLDGTFGIALGYAHTESPYQATKDEPWGDGNLASMNGAFLPGGQKNQVQSSNLKRDGFMGVLEAKPSDKLRVVFDAYHSEFEELQQIARLEYPLAWGGATLASGTLSSDGKFYDSGTFTDVKVIVENYANRRKSTINQVGLNLSYDLTDKWTVDFDGNHQELDREDLILESTAGTGPDGAGATDTVKFVRGANNSYNLTGAVDYSSFNTVVLTDPKGWGGAVGRAGYVKNPTVNDDMTATKLSLTRKFENKFIDKVTFGVNKTEHRKDKLNVEGAILLPGLASSASVPTQYRKGVTDASFLGSSTGMIAYDSLGMWDSGYFGFSQFEGDNNKKNWSVDETITTTFIMANINTTLGSIPVTGNIGFQSVHADQTAVSAYVNNGATSYFVDGTNYTDNLPSLNLNFDLGNDLKVRFGAGTTIVRPRMDDMSGGVGYSVASNNAPYVDGLGNVYYWNADGGNAKLKPWKSTNYDLSVEKYFGRKGYVSAAIFYKDLSSFIYRRSVVYDFTGVTLPQNCSTNCTQADANRIGILSGPANGQGGYIRGIEATASLPLDMVTPILDGFGVTVSGSFNDSAIDPSGTGDVDVPGLSKQIINTTVYYEKNGFSARISNRYRGDFVGEVPDYTNSLQTRNVRAESIYDAQISYTLQSGPAKGLNILLSGANLTNEPFFMYLGDNVVREEKYGATYMVGLSYKW
ncbi:TonB-dependent receptor [Pseudaquidulcibacter saccharophilus]|uniref:TonB-dependent receptor n=1 Tax=Pseudaquidulcibacter saccharophilus TaxID=2831900 RepID=UPI001EFEF3CD|nr:TonB-dependent receptor [Pseudaquidulcibacter saccharophilus]